MTENAGQFSKTPGRFTDKQSLRKIQFGYECSIFLFILNTTSHNDSVPVISTDVFPFNFLTSISKHINFSSNNPYYSLGCPRSVMVKAMTAES